ncbi:MAG: hypothetical protein ICV69_06840 [Thermoleophilaceae bacterium]|nr:hypothetical protein [Thermoleophilaceae bacterium]
MGRLLISRAGAAAASGVRVARALYSRWRLLPDTDRRRLAPLADDAKDKALSVRGAADRQRAETELRTASETLAAALVETAEADPEIDPDEVRSLREDLRRELERLASADIKASRAHPEGDRPPG